jgi:hypothetical protein
MGRGERRLDVIELIIVARAIGTDETTLLGEIAKLVPVDAEL